MTGFSRDENRRGEVDVVPDSREERVIRDDHCYHAVGVVAGPHGRAVSAGISCTKWQSQRMVSEQQTMLASASAFLLTAAAPEPPTQDRETGHLPGLCRPRRHAINHIVLDVLLLGEEGLCCAPQPASPPS
ncbi:hypothetical protein V496_00029 [Pseudogymnoascus sp. VKM F-4515 (FW-2607)]|nr:hypothetical protein V496_00029 [Pseudogymnoascus sp. VKM F-4515 (FW-2607)]